MGLLDGGIQALFGQVFAGLYLDGLWIKNTLQDNGKGGFTKSPQTFAIKYQVDDFSDFHRAQQGIPASDIRVLILQRGVPGVVFEPAKDDRISVGGKEYAVVAFTADPGRSYWKVHGTRVGANG